MGGTDEAPNSHPVIRPDHRAVGWWSIASWAVIGAIASIFFGTALFDLVVSDWATTSRHWLLDHGLRRTAFVYVIALLSVSDIICASVGGAVIGLTVRRRWFRCALSFTAAYVFAPSVLLVASDISSVYSGAYGYALSATISIAAVAPATFGLAWIGSRVGHRRADRRVRGLCPSCAYDLTGNVRGKCPECGKAVE